MEKGKVYEKIKGDKKTLIFYGGSRWTCSFMDITPGSENFGQYVGHIFGDWEYSHYLMKNAQLIGILEIKQIDDISQNPRKAAEILESSLGYRYGDEEKHQKPGLLNRVRKFMEEHDF